MDTARLVGTYMQWMQDARTALTSTAFGLSMYVMLLPFNDSKCASLQEAIVTVGQSMAAVSSSHSEVLLGVCQMPNAMQPAETML